MLQKKSILLPMAVLLLALVTGCSKVPDLTGMTQQQAQDALNKKKLILGAVTTVNQPGKRAGTVVSQDPAPNAKIPDNKTVVLVMQAGDTTAGGGGTTSGTTGGSTGGTPGGTTGGTQGGANSDLVPVPDLSSCLCKAPSDADVMLVQTGLQLADHPDVVINDKPSGKIFAQDPPAGTQVALATKVAVSVASDAFVTVLPVIGQPQAAAAGVISGQQLTPKIVTEIHPGPDAVGNVFDQNPSGGLKVAKGQTVVLKVKQDSVKVPRVVGSVKDAAQVQLFQNGLTPVVQLIFGNTNMVVAQNPPENTEVAKGTPVIIMVQGLPWLPGRLQLQQRVSPAAHLNIH